MITGGYERSPESSNRDMGLVVYRSETEYINRFVTVRVENQGLIKAVRWETGVDARLLCLDRPRIRPG